MYCGFSVALQHSYLTTSSHDFEPHAVQRSLHSLKRRCKLCAKGVKLSWQMHRAGTNRLLVIIFTKVNIVCNVGARIAVALIAVLGSATKFQILACITMSLQRFVPGTNFDVKLVNVCVYCSDFIMAMYSLHELKYGNLGLSIAAKGRPNYCTCFRFHHLQFMSYRRNFDFEHVHHNQHEI